MPAWKLFVHSARQVFGNLGAALKIAALPPVRPIALIIWLFLRIPPNAFDTGSPPSTALHDFPSCLAC